MEKVKPWHSSDDTESGGFVMVGNVFRLSQLESTRSTNQIVRIISWWINIYCTYAFFKTIFNKKNCLQKILKVKVNRR